MGQTITTSDKEFPQTVVIVGESEPQNRQKIQVKDL